MRAARIVGGAIAEGLGAIAVFVTLAYLAVQVRHAREEVRPAFSAAQADAHREALASLQDPRTLASDHSGDASNDPVSCVRANPPLASASAPRRTRP